MGRCRSWTDEQLETAGVLALIYGKASSSAHVREPRLSSDPRYLVH